MIVVVAASAESTPTRIISGASCSTPTPRPPAACERKQLPRARRWSSQNLFVPKSSPALTITFHKVMRPRPHAWWVAVRGKGGTIRGGFMPVGRGVIPHDMARLATEAHLGIEDGFWGLLARGATFRRGTDRRTTRLGRAMLAEHRSAVHAAEQLDNAHHALWSTRQPTPVAATFDFPAEQWVALPDNGTMTLQWPLEIRRPRQSLALTGQRGKSTRLKR